MKTSRANRPRPRKFEALEPREVLAAGITAALNSSGVLLVSGTTADDQVCFQQSDNVISINHFDGAWSAKSVKKIVIDLNGGNDFISLNSVANGGNQALDEKVWVSAAAGQRLTELGPGQETYYADPGVIPVGKHKASAPAVTATATATVSLRSGVLKVTGTNLADNLDFRQISGKISIQGITGSWAATKVKSIAVYLNDGNDVVSLNSLANGGNQALQKLITVYSGPGTETVHLANGHDVTFSGAGHTLKVEANGTVSLDGTTLTFDDPDPTPDPDPDPTPPPANWFNTYVQDAALRSLGNSLFVDGVINRSDILSLFESAKDGGTVDTIEFNDLKAIASNSLLFGTFDYVWKLSTYIVNGNAANAKYQGQSLGNLAAGSNATQLGNLVNKWFLGLDRPTASATYTYREFSGTLFVNGAATTDIRQGAAGDCYLMAALAEFAQHDAGGVTNMFIVNGDGTYTVRFYNNGAAEYVTVDSQLPTDGGGYLRYASRGLLYTNSSNELWVALAEKAYAQSNEMGWVRLYADGRPMTGNGENSYAALNNGYVYAALGHVTGRSTVRAIGTGSSTGFTAFVAAYDAGKMIGFASLVTPASSTIIGSHAYSVVSYDSTAKTITLFNPWGTTYEYAFVTLTWSEIQANFSYFDRTA